MSILFQLFRAEDLVMLDEQQFNQLKKDIQDAMRISPDVSLRLAVGSDLQTHWEDARRELMLSSPRIDRDELQTALRDRARVVFQQLMNYSPEFPNIDLVAASDDLLGQLLSPRDLSALSQEPFKEEIFKIAISCELSYFNSYSFLQFIKELAHNQFRELRGGQLEMGPDSPYRLWNEES